MESPSVIIKKILIEKNMKQIELSELLKMTPQNLNNKIYRNSFSVNEFSNILDVLGYEIKIIKKSEN